MAQENAANGNGRLAEERNEAERFPDPQPDPLLTELIRLVQEGIETRKRTEEEERENRRETLPARKETLPKEETLQRPSPSSLRVRYNLD
jgi:hypothetical protein